MRTSFLTLAALVALAASAPSSSPAVDAVVVAKRNNSHPAPAEFLAGPGPALSSSDPPATGSTHQIANDDGSEAVPHRDDTQFWRGAGARRQIKVKRSDGGHAHDVYYPSSGGGSSSRVVNYYEGTIFEDSPSSSSSGEESYGRLNKRSKTGAERKLVDLTAHAQVGKVVDADVALRLLAQERKKNKSKHSSSSKGPSYKKKQPKKTGGAKKGGRKGGKKPNKANKKQPKKIGTTSQKKHNDNKSHDLVDVNAKVDASPILKATAGVHILNHGQDQKTGAHQVERRTSTAKGVKHLVDVVADVKVAKIIKADVMAKVLRKRTYEKKEPLVDVDVVAKVGNIVKGVVVAKVL